MDFVLEVLELLLDVLLEIIFDGAVESITEKKIPMFVRVAAVILLLIGYIGLVGLLIYIGIANRNGVVIGIAIFLLSVAAYVIIKKYREIKSR